MDMINIRQLGIGEKAAICWSFFWRAGVVTIGSMLAGGLLGGLFGMVIGIAAAAGGMSRASLALVAPLGGGVIGLLAGCFFLYVYVCWLTGPSLGRFRLVLVRAGSQVQHRP